MLIYSNAFQLSSKIFLLILHFSTFQIFFYYFYYKVFFYYQKCVKNISIKNPLLFTKSFKSFYFISSWYSRFYPGWLFILVKILLIFQILFPLHKCHLKFFYRQKAVVFNTEKSTRIYLKNFVKTILLMIFKRNFLFFTIVIFLIIT